MGIATAKIVRLQAHQTQHFVSARGCLLLGLPQQLRQQAHIARDRIVRKQAGILHHVSHLAAQRDDIPLTRRTILHQDFASAFRQQAIGQAQDGSFSGATLPQQGQNLSGAQAQGDAGENVFGVDPIRDVA